MYFGKNNLPKKLPYKIIISQKNYLPKNYLKKIPPKKYFPKKLPPNKKLPP